MLFKEEIETLQYISLIYGERKTLIPRPLWFIGRCEGSKSLLEPNLCPRIRLAANKLLVPQKREVHIVCYFFHPPEVRISILLFQ
jgi:hypothetical protein